MSARPQSAGAGGRSEAYQQQQLTKLSHNKCAPKWSFGGRRGGGSRPGTPGPGSYTAEAAARRKQAPSYGFGTSARDRDPADVRLSSPGPGQYQPAARPRSAAPAFHFGTGQRERGSCPSSHGTPGPGTYAPDVRSTKNCTPHYTATPRRGDGGRHYMTPGPGSYTADGRMDNGKSPAWGFGTATREGGNAGYGPGPGEYNNHEMSTRGCGPAFSMRMRHGYDRADDTPGPGAHGGMHTQFGY